MSRFFASQTVLRRFALCLLLALAFVSHANQIVCAVCGKPIDGRGYWMINRVTGETNDVCTNCAKLELCSICGLPVKDNLTRLPDGRVLCERCAGESVKTDDEAKDVCKETKDDIDRLFSRFMTFPEDNVEITIMDKFHLENLFAAPEFHTDNATVGGATASNRLPDGRLYHTIDLLSHLRKPSLMAVCAHEYTHTWINENVPKARKEKIDHNLIEGLCELVAYKSMESRQDSVQMGIIERNRYTDGRIAILIEADKEYGFNTILEWFKDGEDDSLDPANLDRVRAVQGGDYTPLQSHAVVFAVVPAAPPTVVPNTLVLKGISGTPGHRFALINNTTFEAMEKDSVRVGQTNVLVQCLEIHDNSVVIQVDGSNQKKQLFLKPE